MTPFTATVASDRFNTIHKIAARLVTRAHGAARQQNGVNTMLETIMDSFKRTGRGLALAAALAAGSLAAPKQAVAACDEVLGESVYVLPTGNNDVWIPRPYGVAWNSSTNRYVITDGSSGDLYTMRSDGSDLRAWDGVGVSTDGRGITFGGGYLWAANAQNGIEKLISTTGERIGIPMDTGAVQIAGITYDPRSNTLLVHDQGVLGNPDFPQRILQYGLDGTLMSAVDSPIQDIPCVGIALRSTDRSLFMTKRGNGGMYKMTPFFTGKVLNRIGSQVEDISWTGGDNNSCPNVDDAMGIMYSEQLQDLVVVNGTDGSYYGLTRVQDGRCPLSIPRFVEVYQDGMPVVEVPPPQPGP